MANNAAFDKSLIEMLISVENSKDHSISRGGWDSDNNVWMPYGSLEGGANTIGHGHKMISGDTVSIAGVEVNLRNGITDEQARRLLIQDIFIHQKRAQSKFSEFSPMGKDTLWRDLPYPHRLAMTMIEFNSGLTTTNSKGKRVWGYPSLSKAMSLGITTYANKAEKAKSRKNILKEISRTFEGKRLGRIKDERALLKPLLAEVGKEPAPLPFVPALGENALVAQLSDRNLAILIAKFVEEDEVAKAKLEAEREDTSGHEVLRRESVERENFRMDKENQRREDEATLQREVEEATKVEPASTPVVDETDKVITEQLADVQYFQKPDGSVIKVNAAGTLLD